MVPIAFNQSFTLLVKVSIPTESLLSKIRDVQPCCADIQVFIQFLLTSIQGFNKIVAPLTSMLRRSSLMDSSTSVTQIAVEYDGIDSGGGKAVKKLSKSQKIVKKSEKRQGPEKSIKTIGLEEPSFLTSKTSLVTMEDCWPWKSLRTRS